MKFLPALPLLAACFASRAAAADETAQFTQPPPAIYQQTLAKLLTPLADVLQRNKEYSQLQGDGVILLDEVVHYVDESGRRVSIFHEVDQALNEAGARELAQGDFYYKKKSQHVYLVSAQTIQPDGTKLPIKSDAIFLKTPQEQEGDAIYNDDVSMETVYSDVKPGSITESIIVLVTDEPRIPNEYTQVDTWSSTWPVFWQRLVVDLPKAYAQRLKISNLGQGVPDVTTSTPSPERERFAWEKYNMLATPDDKSEAPVLQTGPLVWLSTLPNWDAFAKWYNSQIQGTDHLSPELKAKIDDWTKGVKEPADILRILYEHVARDVRYTGFELGKADLQPHDCMSVWERQYGDCKDKANLLRAMLEYKGIPSWLALLSSEHAGLVDQASPDYRQFDHCILDVQIGNSAVICDPTITYGEPGLLGGGDTNRELLVIKGDHAEWVHSPPLQNAELSYTFDLQLRPSGELAGWVEKKATGFYAAAELKYYIDLTKDDILDRLQSDIREIYPNCTLADVTPLASPPPPGQASAGAPAVFTIRAYMVLPGVLNQGADSAQLMFPGPVPVLPFIDNYKNRQHATYIWPDVERISAVIQLPPGWQAPVLPAPMVYDSPQATMQAIWTSANQTLTATVSATMKQDVFHPDEMVTLGNAATNLQSWTAKSLALAKSGSAPPAPGTPQTDQDLAANLPTMPTGEGQLNLIETEFPADGNRAARRAALERIPLLFPADQKAIVDSVLDLALMDLDDEKWDAALARIKPAIATNRSALTADTLAWADYISARALVGQNKSDEARPIFQRIVDDATLDPDRRAWAAYRLVNILADKSPASALDVADQVLGLDSTIIPSIYGVYASTSIKSGQADRLKDRLTKLIAAKPENLEDILLSVTNSAQDLMDAGDQAESLSLVSLLESLSNPATTGDAVARAIKKVRDSAETAAAYLKLQQDVKQALVQFPEIAALEKKQPQFSSKSDAAQSMTQHQANSESDEALGCALRILVGYAPDKDFPKYCWDCFRFAEWGMRIAPKPDKEPFFLKFAELADELPQADGNYVDIKLLQAKVLEREGQRSAAGAIYDALAQKPEFSPAYQATLWLRGGNNWAEQGDYAKALASYHNAEAFADVDPDAQEAVLRATFIQLDDGNQTEAARLLKLLAEAVQKGKFKPSEQITKFIAVADGAAAEPTYWDNWKVWWPLWQKLETEAGLGPVKDTKIISIFSSWADVDSDLQAAFNGKDLKKFFTILRQTAYVARDYPDAAQELVEDFPMAEQLLPEQANDFRLLAVAMLEPLSVQNPVEQRRRILNLLINYADSDQGGKGLDFIAREWKPALNDGAATAQAIDRVWAYIAVKQHQDLDQVAGVLETDLNRPEVSNRPRTVLQLADVYVALGRQADAEKILVAEQADPKLAAAPDQQAEIKTLLENIRNVVETSKQLADGVALWLKDNQPAWWNYAEPKSTADPRLARLDDILNNSTDEFQPAELVKAGLLAPTVPTLSAATQQEAVLNSFVLLFNLSPTQDQADALAKTILDNPSFPQSLKADFLFRFLVFTGAKQHVDSFAAFKASPVFDSLTSTGKDIINRVSDFMPVDRTSPAMLTAYVQKLAQHPLDSMDIGVVDDTVTYLLMLGDVLDATSVYQSVANFTIAPGARYTKPELQLALLKEINSLKQLLPAFDALRQVTLEAYPPDTIAKPPGFDQRRELEYFSDLSAEEATRYRLYLIKTHQMPMGLNFWYEFMRDLPHTAASADLNLRLLKAALDNLEQDEFKALIVTYSTDVLDTDDPNLRQRFLDLVQPYRDPVKYPQTMEDIRMFDVTMALRTGQPVNLEADLAGFTGRFNVYRAIRYRMTAYLQQKDLPHLKQALNSLSADQMMSPSLIRVVMPALNATGQSDEAELARDTLAKSFYQHVLEAWYQPQGENLDAVRFDLLAFANPPSVPDDFSRLMTVKIAQRQSLLDYELVHAYVNKNWTVAATVGAEYTQAFPNFYPEYWYYGRSLAELGKNDEAVKALTIYCKYSLNERWYPEAKALLDKLSASQK